MEARRVSAEVRSYIRKCRDRADTQSGDQAQEMGNTKKIADVQRRSCRLSLLTFDAGKRLRRMASGPRPQGSPGHVAGIPETGPATGEGWAAGGVSTARHGRRSHSGRSDRGAARYIRHFATEAQGAGSGDGVVNWVTPIINMLRKMPAKPRERTSGSARAPSTSPERTYEYVLLGRRR